MKIKAIRAFEIDLPARPKTPPREPSRAETIKMTRPVARYPGFQEYGLPNWRRPACVATAEDGTWGLGISIHGGPVVRIINDHFALALVGENCMAIEKIWDLMVRMSAPYGKRGTGQLCHQRG